MIGDLDPARAVAAHIAEHQAALDERISAADTPGNLDGLLARHVLRHAAGSASAPDADAAEQRTGAHGDGPVGAPGLAALGYHLDHLGAEAAPEATAEAVAGLRQLMRRDPFPVDGVTFLHDPRQLLGVTLAMLAVCDEVPDAGRWLRRTIDDSRLRAIAVRHELIRRHVRALLTREPSIWAPDTGLWQPGDLAILHWTVSQGTMRLPDPASGLKVIQNGILKGLLSVSPSAVSVLEAAFLRAAARQIIDATIDEVMLDRRHVGVVLRRFPTAMRRWRYDTDPKMKRPIKWPITMEREVQDILWILLSAVFVDLVDEEPLRKFGHSSYRVDFGIPSLGVLIEIKYARSAAEFRDIEKQVMEDYVAYFKDRSTYQKIVVFIYDASSSGQEHATTQAALVELEHVIDVVIVSRPSQLPPPEPKRRRSTGAPQPGRKSATAGSEPPA